MKINLLAASLEAPELTERLEDLAQKMVGITDKGHMKSLHSQTHGFFPQGESEDGASASEAKVGCPSVTPVPSGQQPKTTPGTITSTLENWPRLSPLQITREFSTGPGISITSFRS